MQAAYARRNIREVDARHHRGTRSCRHILSARTDHLEWQGTRPAQISVSGCGQRRELPGPGLLGDGSHEVGLLRAPARVSPSVGLFARRTGPVPRVGLAVRERKNVLKLTDERRGFLRRGSEAGSRSRHRSVGRHLASAQPDADDQSPRLGIRQGRQHPGFVVGGAHDAPVLSRQFGEFALKESHRLRRGNSPRVHQPQCWPPAIGGIAAELPGDRAGWSKRALSRRPANMSQSG